MLPPGHVAGGYLLAKLVAVFVPALTNPLFFIYTALFAFIPDLDYFVAFVKIKRMIIKVNEVSHRQFISHAPLVYLGVYLVWLLVFPNSSLIAHAFILGTWSHFLLDSFSPTKQGIRWLYPFSKKAYSFNFDREIIVPEADFFTYWINFIKQYVRVFSFKVEIFLVLAAIMVLLTTNY